MTAREAYDHTSRGGGDDFARAVELCAAAGPYCLIGGLAVNCYVEPVYTLDADLVVAAERVEKLTALFAKAGFECERFPHSVNIGSGGSDLRLQITTDPRYQSFPARASRREVLGVAAMVAALEDVAQGQLWAYSDPALRLSKRKKDELDLIRLAEAHPRLALQYSEELRRQL